MDLIYRAAQDEWRQGRWPDIHQAQGRWPAAGNVGTGCDSMQRVCAAANTSWRLGAVGGRIRVQNMRGGRMTKKEMSQLFHLNREIERDKARLAELEAAATGITQRITGLPGNGIPGDKIARYASEIADLKAIIELNIQRCWYELNRLNRYIAEVEDSETRQILSLRFVNGLTWRQVAASMGEGYTEDYARKRAERFFENS